MVYEDWKEDNIYKTKEGREIIHLTNIKTNEHKIVSYPKYLVEKHLDKYLSPTETIHHKDGNYYNNDWDNLEILDRAEHCSKDALRCEDSIIVKCTYCGKEFQIKGNEMRYRNRKDKHSSGYFCSRSCCGKYGREIQMGVRKHEQVDRIYPKKYKLSQIEN